MLAAVVFAVTGGARAAIVAFEAESGTLGANYTTLADVAAVGGSYIAPIGDQTGDSPDHADDLAEYSVTLTVGTYDLYARILVESAPEQGPENDSVFIGNGFGSKTTGVNDDWIKVNNLHEGGNSYTNPESAEITNDTYNWVKFSLQVTQDEPVPQFESLGGTETFQIGHREDGFRVDALAFVTAGETPSSADLTAAIPEPATLLVMMAAGLPAVLKRKR